jgi:hypothetical protein
VCVCVCVCICMYIFVLSFCLLPQIKIRDALHTNYFQVLEHRNHDDLNVHSSSASGARLVVISRAFFLFFPCNHIIDIYIKKSFSGEVKDSVIFPFYFLLHKRAKPAPPPYLLSLPTHTSHAAHLSTHLFGHLSTLMPGAL